MKTYRKSKITSVRTQTTDGKTLLLINNAQAFSHRVFSLLQHLSFYFRIGPGSKIEVSFYLVIVKKKNLKQNIPGVVV